MLNPFVKPVLVTVNNDAIETAVLQLVESIGYIKTASALQQTHETAVTVAGELRAAYALEYLRNEYINDRGLWFDWVDCNRLADIYAMCDVTTH